MKTPDLLSHLHIPRQKPRLQTYENPSGQKHRQVAREEWESPVHDQVQVSPFTRPILHPLPPRSNNWLSTPHLKFFPLSTQHQWSQTFHSSQPSNACHMWGYHICSGWSKSHHASSLTLLRSLARELNSKAGEGTVRLQSWKSCTYRNPAGFADPGARQASVLTCREWRRGLVVTPETGKRHFGCLLRSPGCASARTSRKGA